MCSLFVVVVQGQWAVKSRRVWVATSISQATSKTRYYGPWTDKRRSARCISAAKLSTRAKNSGKWSHWRSADFQRPRQAGHRCPRRSFRNYWPRRFPPRIPNWGLSGRLLWSQAGPGRFRLTACARHSLNCCCSVGCPARPPERSDLNGGWPSFGVAGCWTGNRSRSDAHATAPSASERPGSGHQRGYCRRWTGEPWPAVLRRRRCGGSQIARTRPEAPGKYRDLDVAHATSTRTL